MILRASKQKSTEMLGVLILLFSTCFVGSAAAAVSEDDATNFEYTTKKTKTGLTFQVPEDMPIESRNGIEAPMPFDQYMYGKFKKMDSRLERIEKTLARIETDIKNIKSSTEKSKP
jgi:hypothetical protein